MKKTLILTSILALSACGGGSSHDVQNSGMRVSGDAILSNKNITSMASEILIAKNGTSPNIVRSTSVVNDGTEYIAYHLDDAKFFESDMEEDEYISFGIDDKGQINNMSYHWQDNGSDAVESINRDGPDSSIFTENVYKYRVELADHTILYTDSLPVDEYSKEEIKQAFRHTYDGELSDEEFAEIDNIIDSTDMEPTEYVHHHVIELQGKDLPDSNKLRYGDFGYTTILAKEIHEAGDGVGDDNSVVFGGYEIKEIQNPNLTGMTFSGKAIAALGGIHQNGVKKIETGNTATTLTVDNNGKQTLTMPFDNYYTISVEKPQNGNETITWTGSTSLDYVDPKTNEHKNFALDENQPVNNQHVNMKYYGDTATPSEIVGGVKFTNNDVEFNGAFGVKN
jgi:hypothetical protein